MRFWTVQKKIIVDHINEKGYYTPMFDLSDSVEENPDLALLYNHMLDAFNSLNDTQVKGLIFAFMQTYEKEEGMEIIGIPNIEIFQEFIRAKQFCLKSLWNKLSNEDNVILEIERDLDFNPVFIDLNDFQALMPPVYVLPPYTDESLQWIYDNIMSGKPSLSPLPSGVYQAHLDIIHKEDIVNVHPIFKV